MVVAFFIAVLVLGAGMVGATMHRRAFMPPSVYRVGMFDWLGIVLLIIGAFGTGVVISWPVA